MSEVQSKSFNAEVSSHSTYPPQDGVAQAKKIGFKGVRGFWLLSKELREKIPAEKWPPALGHQLWVTLRVKDNANKPGSQYHDITEIGVCKAGHDVEGWEYVGTEQAPAANGKQGAAPRRHDDATNLSIARQVVVKAEAELLAALAKTDDTGTEDPHWEGLWLDWRDHVRQLWGDAAPPLTVEPATGQAATPADDRIPF